ncbi:MAG: hypothetical protein ACREQ5_23990, partial [Candidatus Dormibacteria bacterium]
PSQTAFLDQSNDNFIRFASNTPNNTVQDFKNSNGNEVVFISGSSGNTLQSNGSNGNRVTFCAPSSFCNGLFALNDFVTLDHLSGDNVFVFGTGGFVSVAGDPNDPDLCVVDGSNFTAALGFSKSNPGIVIC